MSSRADRLCRGGCVAARSLPRSRGAADSAVRSAPLSTPLVLARVRSSRSEFTSEPSSFLRGIRKRRPLSALARRREVEHGPAAAHRLAAQTGVGIHGDRLANQLEEGQVTGVVRVARALAEADTELARDGARPVHLALVDAERLPAPAAPPARPPPPPHRGPPR